MRKTHATIYLNSPAKVSDTSICSSSRPARRSAAAAWLQDAKGDPVVPREGPERWTRRGIWVPASRRRWAMPRGQLPYRAVLPPPITMGPIIRHCIRPTAAPTTTVTTGRPPLTTPGTTTLLKVWFFCLSEEVAGMGKDRRRKARESTLSSLHKFNNEDTFNFELEMF